LLVSETLAIASAFCIALSSMLISELKGRVPLVQLARWQWLAAFAMTAVVSAAIGGWRSVGLAEFGLLAASSVFGIAIGGTTYFAAIYTAGPRVTALLFSLTSPFALALGYLALGETITGQQALGVALVLCGVVLAIGVPEWLLKPIIGNRSPATLQRVAPEATLTGPLWQGVALGVITALCQALGSLLARPAMASGVEPFTAMAVRSGLAALFFLALMAFPFGRATRAAWQPTLLGIGIASAIIGTGLGMSFLMAALHGGEVGIVSTLSSISPVLILPMVWLRSGEKPVWQAWLGALLAIVGVALISLE
jgi:drug/metabolite transporter (DMT)-like permease